MPLGLTMKEKQQKWISLESPPNRDNKNFLSINQKEKQPKTKTSKQQTKYLKH